MSSPCLKWWGKCGGWPIQRLLGAYSEPTRSLPGHSWECILKILLDVKEVLVKYSPRDIPMSKFNQSPASKRLPPRVQRHHNSNRLPSTKRPRASVWASFKMWLCESRFKSHICAIWSNVFIIQSAVEELKPPHQWKISSRSCLTAGAFLCYESRGICVTIYKRCTSTSSWHARLDGLRHCDRGKNECFKAFAGLRHCETQLVLYMSACFKYLVSKCHTGELEAWNHANKPSLELNLPASSSDFSNSSRLDRLWWNCGLCWTWVAYFRAAAVITLLQFQKPRCNLGAIL